MKEFTIEEQNEVKNKVIELLSDKKAREEIEILEYLGYSKELDSEVLKILNDMIKKYDLYRTKHGRYMNFSDSEKAKEYYKGIFIANKSGYGFVDVEGLKEDIFIPRDFKNSAMDGDLVFVHITKGERDSKKCEGKVIEILERNPKTKLAEVIIKNNKVYCVLKNNKDELLTLQGEGIDKLVDGDIITIDILNENNLIVKLNKRIGHKNDPGIDIVMVLAEHEFDVEFPEEVLEQLKTIPTEVSDSDLDGRVDFRDEMIFTIDGDDTKDIDDAISVKKLDNGNYELGVHIANVPYYIPLNSPLDLEARKRGTSVYLADRVVPMYPHQISNGICSLNPNVDRLTISSIMEIDKNGNMTSYKLVPSIIKSRIQMTYNKVNDYLENGIIASGYEPYLETLSLMKELHLIVRQNKINRGYIDFDIDEVKIIVDENANVVDIKKRYRGTGEKMIEDFMILANESVASSITNLGLMGLYRVHGDVSVDRLRKFLNIIKNYNININDDFKFVNQKTMQNILKRIEGLEGYQVIVPKLISCMDKARYDINNIGHFALASRNYTHFTSPIRRYPDTTIHRLINDYMFKEMSNEKIKFWEGNLPDIAETSSERERAAEACEREVDDMKMAEYMESHIGEIYEGMISGITSFGIYVMLPNLVEGMIRLEELPEKFIYDELSESLIGVNSHKLYTLGTKVDVKVIRASKELRQVDFSLYDKEKEVKDEEKNKKNQKKY